ncbi:hypothetical protein EI555_000942, partial [Monodon monoceros]
DASLSDPSLSNGRPIRSPLPHRRTPIGVDARKIKKPYKIPTDNYPIQTLSKSTFLIRGSWNYQLNTIAIEVVNKLTLAGFIRQKYAVCKKVKAKQESELKLKSFAPPYTNNGVAEADGIIHRPLSVTLSKEEPGADPSCLENTLKKLLNKNQEEAGGKATPNENQTGNNQIGNSELPGSQEDSDNDYFSGKKSQFLWKNEDDRTNIIRREDNQERILSKKMKQVKEERRYLEIIKEELIKKVERLLEQGKLKRYHAYDVWKKKYFETKKVTASLEEVLTKLREDLELYYKKLLIQLEARVIKMRPKNLATITDSKNYFIIQITEVQHAIDQLRKLDTDKMKRITEIKMRKQAVSDLCTLKAELAQKKFITSFQSQ